jgi:hypothetical protein
MGYDLWLLAAATARCDPPQLTAAHDSPPLCPTAASYSQPQPLVRVQPQPMVASRHGIQ